jgi:hypothetical protein
VSGEGKQEQAVVESFFKPNYTSRFNVGRITRPGEACHCLRCSSVLENWLVNKQEIVGREDRDERREEKESGGGGERHYIWGVLTYLLIYLRS